MCRLVCCLALSLCASEALGQYGGEEILDTDTYQGVRAQAPVPARYHVRNEGGSDGAGLCVYSSVLANGMAQGVPGLDAPGPGTSNVPGQTGRVEDAPGKGSALWRYVKARPGGSYPEKLARDLDAVMPGEPRADYYGRDTRVLDAWSQDGYPIACTMNTGRFYNGQRIAHMISVPHYQSNGYTCVADNNNPGRYSWMPTDEFNRRQDSGVFWAFVWLRRASAVADPLTLQVAAALLLLLLAATSLLAAVAALLGRKVTPDA